MNSEKQIPISLPADTDITETDLALLKTACEIAVANYLKRRAEWSGVQEKMEKEEWQVKWDLQWLVEAKRDRCSETVMASSIYEAFHQLSDLVRLHKVEGCP